jgi:hypothetical protein
MSATLRFGTLSLAAGLFGFTVMSRRPSLGAALVAVTVPVLVLLTVFHALRETDGGPGGHSARAPVWIGLAAGAAALALLFVLLGRLKHGLGVPGLPWPW